MHFRRIATAMLLVVTVLLLTGFYFASTTSASVSSRTVYSWQFSAGTGEGVIDIDPTNSDLMVYHALGLADYVPFFSMDKGVTWTKTPSFTITTKTVLLDPWISYDSQGRVYAGTYIGNNTHPYDWLYPFLAKSTDHGADFNLMPNSYSPPWTMWTMPDGTLKPSCAMSGPGAIDFPKVAADKGSASPFRDYVYIVGSAGVNSTGSPLCAGLTSFIRSTDGGATYNIHQVLNRVDNQVIVRPNNLALAPNGTIYFAVTYTGGGILLVSSKDGGATWSTTPIPLGYGADEPWIAVSQTSSNDLYVTFERAHADNSIHVYMITSTTGGARWSSPLRLDDTLSNDAVDHRLPTMAVSPDGRIFVAWRDFRNSPSRMAANSNTTDIYAYSSASPGANPRISNSTGRYCGYFSPCYRVSGNDYFTVASENSVDHVAFSLDENNDSWPEAYATIVRYSSTGGPWTSILSPLVTTLNTVTTSLYVVVAGLAGVSAAVVLVVSRRRNKARRKESEKETDQRLGTGG